MMFIYTGLLFWGKELIDDAKFLWNWSFLLLLSVIVMVLDLDLHSFSVSFLFPSLCKLTWKSLMLMMTRKRYWTIEGRGGDRGAGAMPPPPNVGVTIHKIP